MSQERFLGHLDVYNHYIDRTNRHVGGCMNRMSKRLLLLVVVSLLVIIAFVKLYSYPIDMKEYL